jgi:hypothetical protein
LLRRRAAGPVSPAYSRRRNKSCRSRALGRCSSRSSQLALGRNRPPRRRCRRRKAIGPVSRPRHRKPFLQCSRAGRAACSSPLDNGLHSRARRRCSISREWRRRLDRRASRRSRFRRRIRRAIRSRPPRSQCLRRSKRSNHRLRLSTRHHLLPLRKMLDRAGARFRLRQARSNDRSRQPASRLRPVSRRKLRRLDRDPPLRLLQLPSKSSRRPGRVHRPRSRRYRPSRPPNRRPPRDRQPRRSKLQHHDQLRPPLPSASRGPNRRVRKTLSGRFPKICCPKSRRSRSATRRRLIPAGAFSFNTETALSH